MSKNNSLNPPVSKKKRIVLISVVLLLAVILITAAVLLVAFRNHLKAAYIAVTNSKEQIVSKQVENDKKTNEILHKLSVGTMRDLTEEERKALASGNLSYEEALALIRGETLAAETVAESLPVTEPVEFTTEVVTVTEATVQFTEIAPPEITQSRETEPTEPSVAETSATTTMATTTTAVTTAATTTAKTVATTAKEISPDDVAAKNARIEGIIAEIYLLRATYLNKIDELLETSKREYIALPKNQHNLQGKMRFIERTLIPKGNALEAECDARMKELLTELKGILVELSMDTGIINEIKTVYQEQKDLKKAELYNQYSSKLK